MSFYNLNGGSRITAEVNIIKKKYYRDERGGGGGGELKGPLSEKIRGKKG